MLYKCLWNTNVEGRNRIQENIGGRIRKRIKEGIEMEWKINWKSRWQYNKLKSVQMKKYHLSFTKYHLSSTIY